MQKPPHSVQNSAILKTIRSFLLLAATSDMRSHLHLFCLQSFEHMMGVTHLGLIA